MKINWPAILTLIASGGLGAVAQALASTLPHAATTIMNVTAIVGALAALMVQSQQPAAKIVADAPVVDQGGNQIATNISSTSELLKK